MNHKLAAIAFSLLVAGLLVPKAKADEDNQAVLFSLTSPVEVPHAVLPPGRYEIRLLGDGSSMAEIWSADTSRFYGVFGTTPVDRSDARGSRVVFAGPENDTPKRIEKWFYGGHQTGNELLYPTKSIVPLASTPRHSRK